MTTVTDKNHLFCLKKKNLRFFILVNKRYGVILHTQSKISSNHKSTRNLTVDKKMENLDKNWQKSFWELQLAHYSGACTFTFSYNNFNYSGLGLGLGLGLATVSYEYFCKSPPTT